MVRRVEMIEKTLKPLFLIAFFALINFSISSFAFTKSKNDDAAIQALLEFQFNQETYLRAIEDQLLDHHYNDDVPQSDSIKNIVIQPDNFFQDILMKFGDLQLMSDFDISIGPSIHIEYLGDDVNYPVSAISITEFKVKGKRRKSDRTLLIARKVQSPAPKDDLTYPRPRFRGKEAIRLFQEQEQLNQSAPLNVKIAEIPFEYYQAEISRCRQAQKALSKLRKTPFYPDKEMGVYLHADTISVEFNGYLMKARYVGVPEDGTPAGAAFDLINALDECWAEQL